MIERLLTLGLSEISFFDGFIGKKLGSRTLHGDASGFHNIGLIGNFECHVRVLLNEENRDALAVNLTDN